VTGHRRPTLPERQASAVASIATRVAQRWHHVTTVAAAFAPPPLRAATARDGGRTGGHADPVAAIVINDARDDYDELTEAIHAWLEQGKWIEHRQITYLREHPDTHATRTDDLKALCHHAGCDFNAVRRGLCWHHYQAELDAERNLELDHPPHATTLELASAASSSPVTPVAGLCTATVECIPCGQTFTASGFDERVAQADAMILRSRHTCPAIEATG
jgi:hypothetical protein